MSSSVIHLCACPRCRTPEPHPDRELHREINLLVSRLDEQQRRWFVALVARRVGRGGETLLALITGRIRRAASSADDAGPDLTRRLPRRQTSIAQPTTYSPQESVIRAFDSGLDHS